MRRIETHVASEITFTQNPLNFVRVPHQAPSAELAAQFVGRRGGQHHTGEFVELAKVSALDVDRSIQVGEIPQVFDRSFSLQTGHASLCADLHRERLRLVAAELKYTTSSATGGERLVVPLARSFET